MDIDIVKKLRELGVGEDIISDVQQQNTSGLTSTVEIMLENKLSQKISDELQTLMGKSDRADLLLLVDRIDTIEAEDDVKDILL